MASCRECKLYDLDACKDKAGRVRKDRAAKCLWVSVEPYPPSLEYASNRPKAGWISPDDGKDCPCFVRRNQ